MKHLVLFFLLISASAQAAVIHDTYSSPTGWSFNYANTAKIDEKIILNVFVPKCQEHAEKIDCAKDQRDAMVFADKRAKEYVDAEKKKSAEAAKVAK